MVPMTLSQVLQLAPNTRSSYREAFQNGQQVVDRYAISQTPLRLAHFLAQVLHESGALTVQFENLNYSAPRLPVVWPQRFHPKGPLDPLQFANNPERLANEVYGGRMGNAAPGDGFLYRGRGLLQLTGKDSYAEATRDLRKIDPHAPDFVVMPDNVVAAPWCLSVAAAEWLAKGCNALADADNIDKVTQAINGGSVGLEERREWLLRTKAIWH
ncbi:glycoside hydrolase family 19 protein [Rugamonas sp. CCM 8940]|uniref:glycoside hydrolase family 19 protein n=1 Tax=Rugamonas sp. CCM 8940 TaxID=2765359 RepID=UPI0018F6B382|nr:glycoside hydrolase family 19 protein [Rugamonas sp. CCM 8940]MBJ7310798.1 glycoside hydrolase family 19 protein [Rugamonas sp. CCM 8940]